MLHMKARPITLGVIIGNRDFFPDPLVAEARSDIRSLLSRLNLRAVMPELTDTKLGGVETHADARQCAELFARHRANSTGVLVVLPNFGDEKGRGGHVEAGRSGCARAGAGLSG
jgi:L-fucose isomerase-like protein